ncbi:hypothetical protein T260_16015 [Geobacillus thermopakistaniensis]|uniref:Integrase n=1 Tax=Geobacillus thermopakistaniensis (strain MAS1) TaxID=1408282 RepID=A0A7U9J8K2_GEOTM|nr:site-specific integrase [Geobacillus sp. MAS1]ESU70981.1 hypothetical protein T260_16015 [Geobacillus sp. MAS1]
MKSILIDSIYFKQWVKHVNLAESTKRNYAYKLQQFEQYIVNCGFEGETVNFDSFYSDHNNGDSLPIDKEFIDEFIAYIKTKSSSKSSLYITISALRNFFGFLHELKLIKHNPMLYYHNPYYSLNKRDRSLSNEECRKLLKAAMRLDPFSKKYAVLFLLGITCGLRANEIIHLRKSQINFNNSTIFVNKGQKTRALSVHMPRSTSKALFEYLNHPCWKKWSNNDDNKEVFFYNDAPLTYITLRKILNEISKTAGFESSITPHQMRHTLARMMYESNIHLSIIQRQLRHKNICTTIHYLPPSPYLADILNKHTDDVLKN